MYQIIAQHLFHGKNKKITLRMDSDSAAPLESAFLVREETSVGMSLSTSVVTTTRTVLLNTEAATTEISVWQVPSPKINKRYNCRTARE